MIIAVASGKGGTGKTSLAVALAQSLEGPVDLLDCDVEAPNGHIFMKPRWESKETIFAQVPQVDESKCTYCRACSQLCQFKAILVLGETILTFPEMCHDCGGCFLVCKSGALTAAQKELGEVEEGWSGSIRFIHGRLKIGEPLSPPLIREVKKRIDPDRIAILDAPPGTSCPVIQTVKGSDFTVLVTEPTPFGLFDLKLAVEVLTGLGIPCGVVINRSDVGDRKVKDYLQARGLPLLLEIPFDRRIAAGYARGQSLLEIRPEFKADFQNLFREIQGLLKETPRVGYACR
ncbi:MAG: ATP-binding protein [Deltaproteobacteria bacterium]|nr:ATP-binding protein [Deltaproteobacteria bacterium]